jgi:hypothetical protein
MNSVQANALNPESVEHWFELVQTTFEEHQFKPENIWAMDETWQVELNKPAGNSHQAKRH